MPNFKPYNYNQDAMVVVNFEEPIQPDTFEFTLHHLIDSHIDLSAFYDKYKNEHGGRSAYDPEILLKIFCLLIQKASRQVVRFSGSASTISCLKRCPATAFRTLPALPVLSAVIG